MRNVVVAAQGLEQWLHPPQDRLAVAGDKGCLERRILDDGVERPVHLAGIFLELVLEEPLHRLGMLQQFNLALALFGQIGANEKDRDDEDEQDGKGQEDPEPDLAAAPGRWAERLHQG
jgi:hypothetical protein